MKDVLVLMQVQSLMCFTGKLVPQSRRRNAKRSVSSPITLILLIYVTFVFHLKTAYVSVNVKVCCQFSFKIK